MKIYESMYLWLHVFMPIFKIKKILKKKKVYIIKNYFFNKLIIIHLQIYNVMIFKSSKNNNKYTY